MTEINGTIDRDATPVRPEPTVGRQGRRAVLLLDIDCGLCRSGARRWGRLLHRWGIRLGSLARARSVGLLHADAPDAMCLLEGPPLRRHFGADAVLAIVGRTRVAPVADTLRTVPGMRWVLHRAYAAVARRRQRLSCTLAGAPG